MVRPSSCAVLGLMTNSNSQGAPHRHVGWLAARGSCRYSGQTADTGASLAHMASTTRLEEITRLVYRRRPLYRQSAMRARCCTIKGSRSTVEPSARCWMAVAKAVFKIFRRLDFQ